MGLVQLFRSSFLRCFFKTHYSYLLHLIHTINMLSDVYRFKTGLGPRDIHWLFEWVPNKMCRVFDVMHYIHISPNQDIYFSHLFSN